MLYENKQIVNYTPLCIQAFYQHIDGADILEFLKDCLTHEDPNVRSKTCSAIGNMCRHSSYFYSLLVIARVTFISIFCTYHRKRTAFSICLC